MFSMLKLQNEQDESKGTYAIGCAGVVLMDDMDYQGVTRVWRQITPVVIAAVQSAVIISYLNTKKNG